MKNENNLSLMLLFSLKYTPHFVSFANFSRELLIRVLGPCRLCGMKRSRSAELKGGVILLLAHGVLGGIFG